MKTLCRELCDALDDLLSTEECVCEESEQTPGTCSVCMYGKLLKRAKVLRINKPPAPIPNKMSIGMYFHCARCLRELPDDASPRMWAQIEAGWTRRGLQVWCKRHELNIIHIDFEGAQHRANLAAKPEKKTT